MSTVVEHSPSTSDVDLTPKVRHIYVPGQPGDGVGWIAYCGHRKTFPWSGRKFDGRPRPETCVVCLELRWAQ